VHPAVCVQRATHNSPCDSDYASFWLFVQKKKNPFDCFCGGELNADKNVNDVSNSFVNLFWDGSICDCLLYMNLLLLGGNPF